LREAVTDALRLEVAPFGIKVVAIRPGFVATEFNDAANRITGDLMAKTATDSMVIAQMVKFIAEGLEEKEGMRRYS
jgi:NAD(P)-dependent dehydrogenase (short-subunit alcohol dehydrogenase family)